MTTVSSSTSTKPTKKSAGKKAVAPEHQYVIIEDLVYFQLKGRGSSTTAIVSLSKWDMVRKYDWYLGKAGYPVSYQLGMMQLHRYVYTFIYGEQLPSKLFVDHIDRDKLNNADSNLRLATAQENSFNKTTKSNRKGVKKVGPDNYTVTITKDGKRHTMTNIPTEEQAANMYNLMAEELFGAFAANNDV
jgi:hypothetical protein